MPGDDGHASSISRRNWLAYSAATAALAACQRAPRGKIIPYGRAPSSARPGVPIEYATAHEVDGRAVGLIVVARDGRPIKVEGNPAHPSSVGATRVFDQTLVTSLYDPDRARGPTNHGQPASWQTFEKAFPGDLDARGEGLAILLPRISSPLVSMLLERTKQARSGVRVYFHSPLEPDNVWSATKLAFGSALDVLLHPAKARVVLSLGGDFLATGAGHLRHARAWSAIRRERADDIDGMPRLYLVESQKTPTGAAADHRLAASRAEMVAIARAVAAAVMKSTAAGERGGLEKAIVDPSWEGDTAHAPFVAACAKDLVRAGTDALVVVGDDAPVELHVLAYVLNARLGSTGQTFIRPPVLAPGDRSASIEALTDRLSSGEIERLLVLDTNPVYSARSLHFERAMKNARMSICLGLYENETARHCQWFLPIAHPLESWGDTRAHDGSVSVIQPLIEPLYSGRTAAEVLALLLTDVDRSPLALAKASFGERQSKGSFDEEAWETSLRTGVEAETSFGTARPEIREADCAEFLHEWQVQRSALEIHLRADPAVHDGRFSNEPRLLELPDPFSRVAWIQCATMSPGTARAAGIIDGSLVRLKTEAGEVTLPAAIISGFANGVVSVTLGWGRDGSELAARGRGANAHSLVSSCREWGAPGEIAVVGGGVPLPRSQETDSLEGREETIVRLRRAGTQAPPDEPRRLTLFDAESRSVHAWGMTIDLGACTGCNVCVVACQVENNVPVVGARGVQQGRIMHWLRIDRYVVSDEGAPIDVFMPMLCQHCERAPCEYVCPVKATVHSDDGLNEMVYNRCVGTRFCSNNCPYKVRRFNWFDYHEHDTDLTALAENPEVTVRARGVMEKCTFCVQRIRTAEHTATVEDRPLARDEVVSACAAACPTEAIVFGDIADPLARVSKARSTAGSYSVLGELGTEPRVRYLPRRRNPNPELT